MIKIILSTILLFNIYAFSFDKLYFLPKNKDEAKAKILYLINNSNTTIDIAMYNLNYNKFIKALNKASQKGVEVNIFYAKKKGIFDEKINFYKTKNKLHTKIAIFDKRFVYFGSANWKKESFKKSYEVLNITDEKNKVKEFNKFFKKLKESN